LKIGEQQVGWYLDLAGAILFLVMAGLNWIPALHGRAGR